MIVKVTRRHINAGVRCGPDQCPVFRAIKSVVKRGVQVLVGSRVVAFNHREKSFNHKLHKKAQAFIEAFDIEEKVQPTEPSVNIPKQLLK